MTTENLALLGGIFLVILVLALYIVFWFRDKNKPAASPTAPNQNIINLKLQAYERLVILAERISLQSIINRLPAGDLTVRHMQSIWVENIKQEFDYNLSQQIYVSKEVWQAISNLREQNIFIINQVAQTMPPDQSGNELARHITELLKAEPKASLHPVVIEALNFEARQLL